MDVASTSNGQPFSKYETNKCKKIKFSKSSFTCTSVFPPTKPFKSALTPLGHYMTVLNTRQTIARNHNGHKMLTTNRPKCLHTNLNMLKSHHHNTKSSFYHGRREFPPERDREPASDLTTVLPCDGYFATEVSIKIRHQIKSKKGSPLVSSVCPQLGFADPGDVNTGWMEKSIPLGMRIGNHNC